MTYSELRAELEADRAWREAEIREMQNRASNLPESEQERFRRPIILLLYAHYEGFCKFAFQLYVRAVNQEQIDLQDATSAVAVATITNLINQLSDPNQKSDLFRNDLPDDRRLHRYARQREFFQRFEEIQHRKVVIPDEAVDLESNLKPVVLKKNLYLLGLNENRFESFESSIQQLVGARNSISHGSSKTGIDSRTYSRLRGCALKVMAGVQREISSALANQDYRKRAPIPLSSFV